MNILNPHRYPTNLFEFTISVNALDEFSIPLRPSGTPTVNCRVYWGDGESTKLIAYNDVNNIHTYTDTGVYRVKVVGELYQFDTGDSYSHAD
jgi:hypothetical protein